MTSISVKQPIDGLILSNTVRSGVIGLAKSLSNELAPYGITVNSVCPGYTLTNRVRKLARTISEKEGTSPEAVMKTWEAAIPMGRLGDTGRIRRPGRFFGIRTGGVHNRCCHSDRWRVVQGGYVTYPFSMSRI